MLAAPYFNEVSDDNPIDTMAVIGLAAGTIPKQFTQVFGPIEIDGIELDPAIVQAGREFFALDEPNINVILGDGRYELGRLDGPYDVITLDAYKVPYIPWHLTTQEFFEEIRARLSEDGVLAINVGSLPEDKRLVQAITTTLLTVFPSVHTVEVPRSFNSILVASMKSTTSENLVRNLGQLPEDSSGLLVDALETALENLVPSTTSEIIFTDQRAPVETIIDSMVLRYIIREGPAGLPGISG